MPSCDGWPSAEGQGLVRGSQCWDERRRRARVRGRAKRRDAIHLVVQADRPYVSGISTEHWQQSGGSPGAPVRTSGTAWNQAWEGWERLPSVVAGMGKDFYAIETGALSDTGKAAYLRASFLLAWKPGRGAFFYTDDYAGKGDPWGRRGHARYRPAARTETPDRSGLRANLYQWHCSRQPQPIAIPDIRVSPEILDAEWDDDTFHHSPADERTGSPSSKPPLSVRTTRFARGCKA